jgi:hypothetical protein
MKMKTILIIVTTAVAMFASAEDSLEILPRLGVTHYDETDDGFFTSMAAVPMFVFHHDGNVYQSPYVTDQIDDTANYFLEDFQTYISSKGGLEQIVFIGEVSDDTRNDLKTLFSISDEDVVTINDSYVPKAARTMAADWAYANAAVITIYQPSPPDTVRVAVANAAAVAGYLNIPLLFVEYDSVPGDTLAALSDLGAGEVYIVDPGNFIDDDAENQLTDAGYSIAENLTEIEDVVAFMRSQSGIVSMNTFTNYDQTLPAAISGARYGGFCVGFEAGIKQRVDGLSAQMDVVAAEFPTEKFNVGEWEPPDWLRSGESGIAGDFIEWLIALGAEDPEQLEWVTFFGPKGDMQVYLERAIVGDPDEPEEYGCLPGRMPDYPYRNVIHINRSCLYPAVVFANPHYERAIYAYNSFVCHYAEQGPLGEYYYDFEDNDDVERRVNEIFGVPEFDEMGVWDALDDAGYDYGCHAGAYAGTYMGDDEHPFNPPGQILEGFVYYVNNGAFLFYYSGHGSTSSVSASRTDIGLNEEEPWGHPYWPSDDGRITSSPPGSGYSQTEWNDDLENVHSMVSTWDTCLVGASLFNEFTMRHGGAGAMSSYISVSWEGSGWYWCLMGDLIGQGLPMAECYGHANATTTYIFPQGEYDGDSSLYYVWYGDPFMVMYRPGWTPPDPADLGEDYGGHMPGDFLDISLEDFRGVPVEGRVKLSWEVSDGSAVGFNLYRTTTGTRYDATAARIGEIKLNDGLITGASPFTYWDETTKTGYAYAYVLEALDEAGITYRFGPVNVTVGADVPNVFALYQSRPNPSIGSATIAFDVPRRARVTLAVYDISGRRVKTVVDETLSAGIYERDVSGFAPGVYVYRLSADGATIAARKMVVVR